MTKPKLPPISLADSAEEALLLLLVSLYVETQPAPARDVDIADEFMGISWDELAYKGLLMLQQLKEKTRG